MRNALLALILILIVMATAWASVTLVRVSDKHDARMAAIAQHAQDRANAECIRQYGPRHGSLMGACVPVDSHGRLLTH